MDRSTLIRALAWFLGVASLLACAPVGGAGGSVRLTKEDVVIVWDKEHGVEHFVRQAQFQSDQEKFGFIVPTPTVPELSLASDEVFKLLRSQIPEPRTAVTLGCAGAKHGAKKAASARIIRTQTVGEYKAVTLSASDGAAMNEWLAKNGFVATRATRHWLDTYAKRKWVFTAFKFNSGEEAAVQSQTIRLSFKTDHPIYPYSMPRDAWNKAAGKTMSVFFVASSPVSPFYENSKTPWKSRMVWSGAISEVKSRLAKDLHLKEAELPQRPELTIFSSVGDRNGLGSDLYFVEKPYNFLEDRTYAWAGLAGLATVGAAAWRLRARRRQDPAGSRTSIPHPT